jgi:hypothetical protein
MILDADPTFSTPTEPVVDDVSKVSEGCPVPVEIIPAQEQSMDMDGRPSALIGHLATKTDITSSFETLSGRLCEISISHENDYAVATALVYNEELD